MASKADYEFFKEYKQHFLGYYRYRGRYLIILGCQVKAVMDTYADAYKFAEAVLGNQDYLIAHVSEEVSVVTKGRF